MKDIRRYLEHDKYILVIEGFDYLKNSSGTSKAVKSHELLFREHGFDYVCIYPFNLSYHIGMKHTGIYGVSVNGKACGYTTLNNLKFLLAQCERKGHGLSGILIHHAINNPLNLLGRFLASFKGVRKVFYLHDYWTCCLSIDMMPNRAKNTWCHSDMKAGCDGCIWEKRNEAHRAVMKRFFERIGPCEFVAPSKSVATEWIRRNPSGFTDVHVIGHLKARTFSLRKEDASEGPVRVAFVGAAAVHKGWLEFQSVAKHCHRNVRLYHMGHTDLRLLGVQKVDVQIHKQGLDAMIRALREHRICISLLLSGCLETYSYTLFESLQAKSLVCCFEGSGNVADVIHETGLGWCFKDLDALQEFLNSKDLGSIVREKQKTAVFPEAMVTNDEIVAYFDGKPMGDGREALSAQFSLSEAVKAALIATAILAFNRLKRFVKGLLRKIQG